MDTLTKTKLKKLKIKKTRKTRKNKLKNKKTRKMQFRTRTMLRKSHSNKAKLIKRTRMIRDNKQSDINESINKSSSNVLPVVVYGKIYANWCGHCKALDSFWEEITAQYPINVDIESEEKDKKVAEFNAKYTPTSPLDLDHGYPTIYKLDKPGGTIAMYNDDRNKDSIISWLNENNSQPDNNEAGVITEPNPNWRI